MYRPAPRPLMRAGERVPFYLAALRTTQRLESWRTVGMANHVTSLPLTRAQAVFPTPLPLLPCVRGE
jgi:hypothetical protein